MHDRLICAVPNAPLAGSASDVKNGDIDLRANELTQRTNEESCRGRSV